MLRTVAVEKKDAVVLTGLHTQEAVMMLWMNRLHCTARFRGRDLQTNGQQVCFQKEEHVPLFISSFNVWVALYFGLDIFNIPAKNNSLHPHIFMGYVLAKYRDYSGESYALRFIKQRQHKI